MKNLIHTQYFSQLHAFEYEYEYFGLLFQYIVTIMKSMHDSGKKMEWKNNRKLSVSLFIHEVQSHIKGNKFHFGAFISKQVAVH